MQNLRVKKFISEINAIMPEMVQEFLESDLKDLGHFYDLSTKYSQVYLELIQENFWFYHDFEALYEWLGMPIGWMRRAPYDGNLSFPEFMRRYKSLDGGFNIVDKIVTDVVTLSFTEKIKNGNKNSF